MDGMYGYGGGGGGGFNMLANKRSIGTDTSSKDPVMIRSRIFIGGLNTFTVSRDDVIELFGNYGTILGVTLFKVFAFVQYSAPSEADLAVSALNLYNWHGSVLDVKIQSRELVEQSAAKKAAAATGNPIGDTGRRYFQEEAEGAKRGKFIGPTQGTETTPEIKNEISDIFICGNCRYTTSLLEAFANHRKAACDKAAVARRDDEPEKFGCSYGAACDQTFTSSWDLMQHLSTNHSLTVFKDVSVSQPQETN